MAFDPEPLDEEDTNVVVARVHRANQKKRLLVVGAVSLVPALLAFWIITGRQSCKDQYYRDLLPGGVQGSKSKPVDDRSWVVRPEAKTARVIIDLSEPGLLFINDLPQGTTSPQTVELEPGTHTIRAEIRGADMRQMMTVKAGEEFRLRFLRDIKNIELDRVPPPGR